MYYSNVFDEVLFTFVSAPPDQSRKSEMGCHNHTPGCEWLQCRDDGEVVPVKGITRYINRHGWSYFTSERERERRGDQDKSGTL